MWGPSRIRKEGGREGGEGGKEEAKDNSEENNDKNMKQMNDDQRMWMTRACYGLDSYRV